jgi:hypothetical protein
MRTAFPSSLAGRDACDYYGTCVAVGLASCRRSHVRPCRTCERDVGGPLISLNALAGHRSTFRRLPRLCFVATAERGTGFRRLSGGWEVASTGDWASGNPAFAISRGSPNAPPQTPGHDRWFSGMLLSPLTFRRRVSHPDPGTSLQVPPNCVGNTAVRSTRGALPVLLLVGFPVSPPEPGVHLTAHRALHRPRWVAWFISCSARP